MRAARAGVEPAARMGKAGCRKSVGPGAAVGERNGLPAFRGEAYCRGNKGRYGLLPGDLVVRKNAAIIAVLAACLGVAPFATRAAELRIGFTSDPLTLDPANYRLRETETIIRLIHSGIAANAPDMTVVPDLAKSWQWTDPKTLLVSLREGVRFQSGETMTADDIVYSFTRLLKEGGLGGQTSPRRGLLGPVTEVAKVDDHTVRFVLSEPWPVLPAMLTFQEVVSKDFVGKVGTPGLATQADGTGPFGLVQWRRGDSLVLERFPGYFGGPSDIPPAGKACVDRLIVKIIPENAARVAALLAGDVDVINDLPAHDIRTVEANPNTRVAAVNGTRTFFVALNNARKPFDDVRVRQAANYAVDRQIIIDRILNGHAVALNGVMSPAAFGFNPDLPTYGYDPAKARALLAEAGHPNGIDVTLDTDGPQKDTAEAIASLLTRAGIRTKVQVGEAAQLRARWAPDGPRDGDMWISSWGNGSLDPTDIFVPTLRTKDRGNAAGYSNPEVDRLLDAAGLETDQSKRAGLYRDAQAIVNRQAPWIFLWLPQDLYGASKRLVGWQPLASGMLNLRDACVQ